MTTPGPARVRLQKFLSDAGVASRRHAEELILAGRVVVNDAVVDQLPAFVDPAQDRIFVNGARVRAQRLEYWLLHKPKGVVCTNKDPAGRTRAVDLLPELGFRLFPVGRLDADSSGLLLMTNDGELAERLTHPRFGVPKTYRAEVRGHVAPDLTDRLRSGVWLSEGRAQASEVEIVHSEREKSVLMITLREGRNRQVRRMLARLGHPVRNLKRVQFGPLSLRQLPLGATRRLLPKEVAALRAAAAEAAAQYALTGARPPRRRPRGYDREAFRDRPPRPERPARGARPQTRGRASGPGRRPRRDDGPPSRRLIT